MRRGQPPVQATVRVRLAPTLRIQDFERWLRASRPVQDAALVTGDADYELRIECRSFADLGDSLTRVCGYPGVEVVSAGLVLHEVAGLERRKRARRHAVRHAVRRANGHAIADSSTSSTSSTGDHSIGDEVTLPRQRMM
ncbi:MAG TPA: Lrp/AsnC ligand binding domain-containing protein [Trebonia sp.]|nr:Lrp/AsnC ligand binding domain-containing protein [Trebonia sp.]